MLISALCEYADKQEQANSESRIPDGWGKQNISYRIMLTKDGDIADIVDIRTKRETMQKNGKSKTVLEPITAILPERTQKTAICSNIIEHRPLYIFGLELGKDGFKAGDKNNKATKSHEDFVKVNYDFFTGLDSEICTAYRNFIAKWNPESECENPKLKELGKNYNGSYFGFGLHGGRGNLEDDEQFKSKYAKYLSDEKAKQESTDAVISTCGILGQKLPIARIHDKVSLPGGNTTGCVLVGMKEDAYQSYGKTQSYNSNISELAMKKYTSAFNKLVADKNHRVIIGDMTIIYFAMKTDDSKECSLFANFFASNAEKTEDDLNTLLSKAKSGAVADLTAFGADNDVTFYVVGLTPNSSRISQKFIYRDKFGSIINNLVRHQKDLKINAESDRQIYFSSIEHELISPKATNAKVPSPLMTGIMMSAFNGSDYPVALLETVVRRVKTDSDEEKNHYVKLNDTRAGIIKACINRKTKKEEITMSLNTENQNSAYLCGRLFAVYEKIQKDSLEGGSINRTIKDSYFASACSRPSAIMTKLSILSQNHLRKLSEKNNIYYSNLIGEIMDKLNGEFPQTLDLDSQGRFIIGYYQQNKDLYTKKESKDN
jgi:CRISPR-associated protein Csd1